MNNMNGLWPGEVASYDGPTRICRVRISGVTDGSDEMPQAVFNNPLGDRAPDTEIRILVGDPVWLMFEAGDSRFPIIMGYRTPREGCPVNWRRWHHANIELTADGVFRINAAAVEINGVTTINGETKINGDTAVVGDLTDNGVNVGSTHHHGGIQPGSGSTLNPS